jgi:hypothetical protein
VSGFASWRSWYRGHRSKEIGRQAQNARGRRFARDDLHGESSSSPEDWGFGQGGRKSNSNQVDSYDIPFDQNTNSMYASLAHVLAHFVLQQTHDRWTWRRPAVVPYAGRFGSSLRRPAGGRSGQQIVDLNQVEDERSETDGEDGQSLGSTGNKRVVLPVEPKLWSTASEAFFGVNISSKPLCSARTAGQSHSNAEKDSVLSQASPTRLAFKMDRFQRPVSLRSKRERTHTSGPTSSCCPNGPTQADPMQGGMLERTHTSTTPLPCIVSCLPFASPVLLRKASQGIERTAAPLTTQGSMPVLLRKASQGIEQDTDSGTLDNTKGIAETNAPLPSSPPPPSPASPSPLLFCICARVLYRGKG